MGKGVREQIEEAHGPKKGRCMICWAKTNLEDYVCDSCIPVRNAIVKENRRTGYWGDKSPTPLKYGRQRTKNTVRRRADGSKRAS